MLRVEQEVEISKVKKIVYEFGMLEGSIYLEYMSTMERQTSRHGWRLISDESYSRLNKREYRLKEEPDVPIDIAALAVWKIRNTITFKKWVNR